MTDNTTPLEALAEGKISLARPEAPGVLKRTSAYFIDPKMIALKYLPDGTKFNPRFDFGNIEELAKSIETHGVQVALIVKRLAEPNPQGQVFELIDGERRLSAIQLLLKKGVKFPNGIRADIVDKGQDDIKSLTQMFIADDGKKFSPLEEAAAYDRMKKAGMTIQQICTAVSRRQVHVVEILALVNADESVKDAVRAGAITKTQAKKISTHARGNKEKQAELVAAAKAAGKDPKKRRAVVQQIDDARRDKAAAKGQKLKMRRLADDDLHALGESMVPMLLKKLKEAGAIAHKDNPEAWINKDDQLAAAFTFGVLQGLKAAAGVTVNLDL